MRPALRPGPRAAEMVQRRILVVLLLAAAAAALPVTLPAQSLWVLGVGTGYAAQNTASGQPWNAVSLDIMETTFSDGGQGYGLYTAGTLGLLLRSTVNGAALDLSQYTVGGLDLNLLFGFALRVPFFPRWTALAGAGLFYGLTMLQSTNLSLSSFTAGGIGPAVGIALSCPLFRGWQIALSVAAGYSLVNPADMGPTMYPLGLRLFGGIGLAQAF